MKKADEKPEIKIYRECNYCAVCEAYVRCGEALCPCCKPERAKPPPGRREISPKNNVLKRDKPRGK